MSLFFCLRDCLSCSGAGGSAPKIDVLIIYDGQTMIRPTGGKFRTNLPLPTNTTLDLPSAGKLTLQLIAFSSQPSHFWPFPRWPQNGPSIHCWPTLATPTGVIDNTSHHAATSSSFLFAAANLYTAVAVRDNTAAYDCSNFHVETLADYKKTVLNQP